LGCGEGCEGKLNLPIQKLKADLKGWSKSEFPLACFNQAGFDPSKMATAFAISSAAKGQIAIHAINLMKSNSQQKSCSSYN